MSESTVAPEVENLVLKAVGAARDEIRELEEKLRVKLEANRAELKAELDANRDEAKSLVSRITGYIAIFTAVIVILSFFGINTLQQAAMQKLIETGGLSKLETEAREIVSRAKAYASEAQSSADLAKGNAGSSQAHLTAIKKGQAQGSGFYPVLGTAAHLSEQLDDQVVNIPGEVSETAKEVLVFCYAFSGNGKVASEGHVLVSSTDFNGRACSLRLFVKTYQQTAVGFNSEHFWLPLPKKGEAIKARWEGFKPVTNTHAYISVVGYR